MKTLASIALIFLYSLPFLRPAVPFMAYQANFTYYSEVLCVNQDKPEMQCHGVCHLKQELEAAAEEKEAPVQLPVELPEVNAPQVVQEKLVFITLRDIVFHPESVYRETANSLEKPDVPVPPPRA